LHDAQALHGEELFGQIGCGSCHSQKIVTGVLPDWPELSNQTIHPYTDLLLHDMGSDLADGRPDFEGTGSEWRTPPLWGLGLSGVIDGYLFLLDDARARNFAEAADCLVALRRIGPASRAVDILPVRSSPPGLIRHQIH
jgi:CxxC motif-containing protein (DUF1111 family)